MLTPLRFVLACVVAYAVFTLWRAYKYGVIFNHGTLLDRRDRPLSFAVTVLSQIVGCLIFAWIAIGGNFHAIDAVLAQFVPFHHP